MTLHAIGHLLAGHVFDATPLDIDEALGHLMAASRQIDRTPWVMAELRRLADMQAGDDLMARRLRSRLAEFDMATGNGGS